MNAVFARLACRRPFACCLALALLSNIVGTTFSFLYNKFMIVDLMTAEQQSAFWNVVAPVYNGVIWPLCLTPLVALLVPLGRCRRELVAGRPVDRARLERCQRGLLNFPSHLVGIHMLGWLPGAVFFPLGVCVVGGWERAGESFTWFAVSFVVSALLTTAQTFFLIESFLIQWVYPDFFEESRPAEVPGAVDLSFKSRLLLYWVAVSVVPMTAMVAVVLASRGEQAEQFLILRNLTVGVAVVTLVSTAGMSAMVGLNLLGWIAAHTNATKEIARENYTYRIAEKRPDELGRLTDNFNDMAADLGAATHMRQTFGEFLNPEVLEEILTNFKGFEGKLEEVTVVFLDIRGFTKRCADKPPGEAVVLLNRFLTLAVAAIEDGGGWVNKFLGDGLMALFGSPRPGKNHADLAALAALSLLERLQELNRELESEGIQPLAVGVGIHTGRALVGCIGAGMVGRDGRSHVRREFTAIGETVNLASRIEQLTKKAGGPILVTEATHERLTLPTMPVGHFAIDGIQEPVLVHRLVVPS